MKSDFIQRMRDLQHFGEEGGVIPSIELAATSTFLNPKDMEKTFSGEKEGCYLYSRHSNPTNTMFGQKMAALENTEAALGVASGMAAISCAIEQICFNQVESETCHEIISSLTVYGGTYALFKNILPRQGIKTHFVDVADLQKIESLINSKTRLIYIETLSNPLLNLSPIKELSLLCQKHKIKLVVDNTFTPCLIQPRELGADVVIHSCTKYISGNADMIAGAICGSKEFINQLIDVNSGMVMLKGAVLDSRLAHELYLRLEHLSLRMKAHSESALSLCRLLDQHNIKYLYPGSDKHPQHEELKKVLHPEYGFGGMMTVELPSAELAMNLASDLQKEKFGLYAVSLGFSRTLMTVPSITTSSEISAEDQKKMNLTPGLLRLSLGYTGNHEEMNQRFLKSYGKIIN